MDSREAAERARLAETALVAAGLIALAFMGFSGLKVFG